MRRFIILIFFYAAVMLLFTKCNNNTDRQIKLAPRPMGAIMQDELKMVQIAIEEKTKIAVLVFENQSANPDADWLSIGLMRMLASSLEQYRNLIVTQASVVNETLSGLGMNEKDIDNSRACQRFAAEVKADVVVSGLFRNLDDSLTIEITLHDGHSGRPAHVFSSLANVKDMKSLTSAMSKLAYQVRINSKSDKGGIPEVSRSLADVSTNSLQAYKYYLTGLEQVEQFLTLKAMASFSKAIELDTTFASAYLSLAHTMLAQGLIEQSRPILQKAVAYAEYVPERERLPILAMNAMINGEPYKAVAIYTKAVELFPEDDEVHYELGNYYFSIAHDYRKAIEKYETTIELNPKHKLAYNQLAYSYAYVGEIEHALYILEKYAELAPDEANPLDSYGEIAQREDRLKEAVEKYKMALKTDPNFWPSRIHLAMAYQDQGKFRKAKSLLVQVLRDSLAESRRRSVQGLLAYHEIVTGHIEKAENIWQQLLAEDSLNVSAVFSLLAVRPENKKYQRLFANLVHDQLEKAREHTLAPKYLFAMLSTALRYDLALDDVDTLVDLALTDTHDPIVLQAAIAYKEILNVRNGGETSGTALLRASANKPSVFQFANPVSWDDYWRHYFGSFETAQKNGVDIRAMAAGFYNFSQTSNNWNFKLNSYIARAAAEFYSGDPASAKKMLNSSGIPCEGDWDLLGPFKMTRGFDQQFWPEKKKIETWLPSGKYAKVLFNQTDSLFDGYVDLKSLGKTSFNDAMYALLQIDSPTFLDVQLLFGMSGRLKVWLNDSPVMTKNIRSRAIIDQFSTTVQLRPGVNWMMVRLNNAVGDMGFYFRLTDKNGDSIERVKFNAPKTLAKTKQHPVNGEKEGA